MGRRGRRSSSAFLGANGGSKSWSFGGRQRNFPTCGTGVRVGKLQRHAGAREHVNWSRQPRALAGMFVVSRRGTRPRSLGTGVCWGVGTGGHRLGRLETTKSHGLSNLRQQRFWQAPRFSLSLATLLSGPVESGALFRGHEEKEQNRNCDKPLLSNK